MLWYQVDEDPNAGERGKQESSMIKNLNKLSEQNKKQKGKKKN